MKGFLLTVLLLFLIILLGWYLILSWQENPAPPPEQLVWQDAQGGEISPGKIIGGTEEYTGEWIYRKEEGGG
ncbi:MAG TPA: hypothetical protein GX735_04465 [Firmicutes bacterium]|nr:hypothetical protein [Bacillota bacterium]